MQELLVTVLVTRDGHPLADCVVKLQDLVEAYHRTRKVELSAATKQKLLARNKKPEKQHLLAAVHFPVYLEGTPEQEPEAVTLQTGTAVLANLKFHPGATLAFQSRRLTQVPSDTGAPQRVCAICAYWALCRAFGAWWPQVLCVHISRFKRRKEIVAYIHDIQDWSQYDVKRLKDKLKETVNLQ